MQILKSAQGSFGLNSSPSHPPLATDQVLRWAFGKVILDSWNVKQNLNCKFSLISALLTFSRAIPAPDARPGGAPPASTYSLAGKGIAFQSMGIYSKPYFIKSRESGSKGDKSQREERQAGQHWMQDYFILHRHSSSCCSMLSPQQQNLPRKAFHCRVINSLNCVPLFSIYKDVL